MTERRMKLTEEEARHIEQRRLMENRFNLGYNEGISFALSVIDNLLADLPNDGEIGEVYAQLNKSKKVIRP